MPKIKLPRFKIHHFTQALMVCRSLDVTNKFRYASNRTVAFLEGEIKKIQDQIKATEEAFPQPDLTQLKVNSDEALKSPEAEREAAIQLANEKNKKLMEDHAKWTKEIEAHNKEVVEPFMKEEVEVEIYQTDLIEINDTVNIPPERRIQQNQALLDALMPIFKE